MRMAFTEIFDIRPDASVRAKIPVRIGPLLIHAGATFGRGAFFGGVELAALTGHTLEVTRHPDQIEIEHFARQALRRPNKLKS